MRKHGFFMIAVLLLSCPAYADEVAAPAEAPAAAPAPAQEIAAPPPEVALPPVEVAPPVEPVMVESPPVVTPDIGASMPTPDMSMPPAIEAPALAAPADMPVIAPAPEVAPIDAGLKMTGSEHYGDGDHGDNGGTPEAPHIDLSIDTKAVGIGGSAHAEGGDANASLKNDVDLSNVNVNKAGDVSNTGIVAPEINASNTNVLAPHIDTTNVVKPVQVQETTVVNGNTNVDVTVKPHIDVDVGVKTGSTTVVLQAPVAQRQESSMSNLTPVIAIGGIALLASKNGGDRERVHTRESSGDGYREMCLDQGGIWNPNSRPKCKKQVKAQAFK